MKKIRLYVLLFAGYLNSQVGVNTNNPDSNAALDINGKTIIRDVPVLGGGSLKRLSINENGLVGIDDSRSMFIIQSPYELFYSTGIIDDFNSGKGLLLDWFLDEDVIRNDDLVEVNNKDYFLIKHDGVYDINGFINVGLYVDISLDELTFKDYAGVDFQIQHLSKGVDPLEGKNWETIASSRDYWNGVMLSGPFTKTINLSLVNYELKSGDGLRCILQKSVESNKVAIEAVNVSNIYLSFLGDFRYSSELTLRKL